MAATSQAVLIRAAGASLAAAFPQINGVSKNYDLLQIVNEGGNVLLNVDYAGVVHNPASGATGLNVRIGRFLTRLSSSATTAQLFADAFKNFDNEDIIQVQNVGGNISYYLDYLGVAHGA